MNEPKLSLTGKAPGYFVLRVLFLPTWGRPVAVRYKSDGVNAVRRAVMLSGEGGYEPGREREREREDSRRSEISYTLWG